MSALDAIDYEIAKLRTDIPKYQASANKVAFRKSERDLHADRVVEWGEHRLAQLQSSRAAIAELIEAGKRMDRMHALLMAKTNHAASFYDAECFREMNEAPLQMQAALARVGGA